MVVQSKHTNLPELPSYPIYMCIQHKNKVSWNGECHQLSICSQRFHPICVRKCELFSNCGAILSQFVTHPSVWDQPSHHVHKMDPYKQRHGKQNKVGRAKLCTLANVVQTF